MTAMANSVIFRDVNRVEIVEYPIPEVDDNEILIKVDACAICTWEQRVYTGEKKVEYPFIGGHELSGSIIKLGKGVDQHQWKIGDKVVAGTNLACKNCFHCKTGTTQNCENFNHSKQMKGLPYKGMGGLSSHLVFTPDCLFKYKNIAPEEATMTEPVSCVLHSVESGDIQFGDTVVVIGCGIMGLIHLMLSKKRGAVVIVSDTNEERLALAKQLGADYLVNPSAENLQKRVFEITDGVKAQVVFDTTPIPEVVKDAVDCIANTGKVILYSSFYPDKPISLSPDLIHKKAFSIMGSANSNERDFMRATRLLSEKVIDTKCFISETYNVSEIRSAFESAAKGNKYRVIVKF